ncbi:hypothetical protein DENSPDRAFT_879758 [Dentipellis sp. KUC8613]|nr:hypothetical protein DENSPDRAFT_879758 [Dentipellis sp. KUC8613]
MATAPSTVPSSFRSAYRLFLRAVSASVLHNKHAKRDLIRIWRPSFHDAAKVICKRDDRSLSAAERQRCEQWVDHWGQNLDNTMEFLLSSANSGGLAHKVTRNLSQLHFGYYRWVKDSLFRPILWDPSPESHANKKPTLRADNRAEKKKRRMRFDEEGFGALEETVRMAEATSGLLLGRIQYFKKKA